MPEYHPALPLPARRRERAACACSCESERKNSIHLQSPSCLDKHIPRSSRTPYSDASLSPIQKAAIPRTPLMLMPNIVVQVGKTPSRLLCLAGLFVVVNVKSRQILCHVLFPVLPPYLTSLPERRCPMRCGGCSSEAVR